MALFQRRSSLGPAPIEQVNSIFADLDGVVYRGKVAIPHAVECLNRAAESVPVGYLTNNAARTDETVAAHLRSLGLTASADDIVTSPQAAIDLLREKVAPGALVLVVGGEGITAELEKAGYRHTRLASDNPDAVLQGFSPDVGWKHLAEACYALAEQPGQPVIPWIATNTDWTLPQEQGLAPGNGTLVSAVHTAVQRLPEFAGKPEPAIFATARARFGGDRPMMIGDRLDTDIQGANAADIVSAFVLTGVDRPKQLIAAPKGQRPTWILPTLEALFEPYPETLVAKDGTVTVGNARVTMNGHVVIVKNEGDDPLNLLRAGCAAVYRSGLAIYGLQVPEVLLEDHWLTAAG